MNCSNCGNEIPQERIDLGFETCIECSTEQKYGVIHVFSGKTANTVQVIKDPELAKKLNFMQTRRNYGVAKGMYRKY
jgi:hypothetical protein